MPKHESAGQELAKGAEQLALHVAALVAGLVLMVAGVAMGVSVVLLPVGIAVGLAGTLAFMWGLFGRSRGKEAPGRPPGSP
jgi:hypothetical protein